MQTCNFYERIVPKQQKGTSTLNVKQHDGARGLTRISCKPLAWGEFCATDAITLRPIKNCYITGKKTSIQILTELVYSIVQYIFFKNPNVMITVLSTLFVPKTDSMTNFVDNSSHVLTARTY